MHPERTDDALHQACVTSWKKNQILAFQCLLFRRETPELLQQAEKEGQVKQRELRNASGIFEMR